MRPATGPDYDTDVPAGDIAIRNVAELYLYPDTIRAVRITGARLRDWLEMSAGMFNRITSGPADQMLLNPDFGSFNFDVIDGVTYRIDLSQLPKFDRYGAVANPHARRIPDLTHGSAPVDAAADGTWSVAPMPGTSVLFDTGPAAAAHLDQRSGLRIEAAGQGADGFARYRILL